MTSRLLLFLVPILGLCSCAAPKNSRTAPAAPDPLVALMVERLQIAREVAWMKFQNSTPVKDPQREKELLASLVEQGNARKLPAGLTTRFFEAQIRASRTVQNELIRGWKRGTTLPAFPPQDLVRDIRPRLDVLSRKMLDELARRSQAGQPLPSAGPAMRALRESGFSWPVAWQATAPLR